MAEKFEESRDGRGGTAREGRGREFEEIVIKVNRHAKVTKGGKRMSFSALVAVGNKKGKVGIGYNKAAEVPFAVRKAIEDAKRNMIDVKLINGTIPHTIISKVGASRVFLKPAKKGVGLKASASVRAPLELAGVEDVSSKIIGSRNPLSVVRATMDCLEKLTTKEDVSRLRGVNLSS